MTGPRPKKLAEQRATHCRDGSSGAPCPTQVVSWFHDRFNQLIRNSPNGHPKISEICRFREVWDPRDPNLKSKLSMTVSIIQRCSETEWDCTCFWFSKCRNPTAMHCFICFICFILPRHWAPQPQNYHPGQGPRRGRQRDGSTSCGTDMNRPGLAGSFQSQRVKNVQVISGG